MTDAPSAIRALSFGSVADAYDRYRPAPPDAAVDWIVPSGACDILDLGAGTGALTRLLIARTTGKVVAAEPDARMGAVLARRSPGALIVGARAEALPLCDSSFEAVVASSSWHWMDPVLTFAEVARVLRPGGRLGVLWSGPAREIEWVADLLGPRSGRVGPDGSRRPRHQVELPAGAPFTSPETLVITWSMPVTRDDLVGLAGTYSGVITRTPDKQTEFLSKVQHLVASHPMFGNKTSIELPMACRCWRATRM